MHYRLTCSKINILELIKKSELAKVRTFTKKMRAPFSDTLKKEERAKKEAEELEQRLRDEDKYDNDYRKRHS